jgi:hypothetical protein
MEEEGILYRERGKDAYDTKESGNHIGTIWMKECPNRHVSLPTASSYDHLDSPESGAHRVRGGSDFVSA